MTTHETMRNGRTSQVGTQEPIETGSDLLTVTEVARILRVDDTTVRRWVKLHILEAVTLPHAGERQSYRIKRETLIRVLGSVAS